MSERSAAGTTMVVYEGRDLEALYDLANYQRWIVDAFRPSLHGRTIEFGAGIGAISRHLLPTVEALDLVEPSANLAAALRERFAADPRVSVRPVALEDFLAGCDANSYDTCVLVNLLEHIRDDVAALKALHGILRPGGTLLGFVPAMPSLFSRLDALLGHHRRYTRAGLAAIVADAGFSILTLRYFDLLGVVPWWLINTLGGKRTFDPAMARLYDRVGVPLTRAIESVIAPPFGKNLLLVARRER